MSGPGGGERSGAGAELRCAVRGGPARGSAPSQLRCPALLERPRCGAATAAGTAGVTQLFAVPAGGGWKRAPGAAPPAAGGRPVRRAAAGTRGSRGTGQRSPLHGDGCCQPGRPAPREVRVNPCCGAPRPLQSGARRRAGPCPAQTQQRGPDGTVNERGCFRIARRKGHFVATNWFKFIRECGGRGGPVNR